MIMMIRFMKIDELCIYCYNVTIDEIWPLGDGCVTFVATNARNHKGPNFFFLFSPYSSKKKLKKNYLTLWMNYKM